MGAHNDIIILQLTLQHLYSITGAHSHLGACTKKHNMYPVIVSCVTGVYSDIAEVQICSISYQWLSRNQYDIVVTSLISKVKYFFIAISGICLEIFLGSRGSH